LTAIATLGFGIAASTTMFSLGYGVLIRALPYDDPNRLVSISESDRFRPSSGPNVATADFFEWQRANVSFSGMADYGGIDERGNARYDLYLTGIGTTRIVKGLVVSNNLFDVLSVHPLLGRVFRPNDDRSAVILSYGCWQTQFAGDRQIIGRSIMLSGMRRDVVGIMPRGFFFPNKEVDVFMPPGQFTPDRTFYEFGVIARLRPGISLRQASAEMAAIGLRLQKAFPQTNANLQPRVEMLHSALASHARPALLMLFSAVSMLFLIVCSNVAHLQFARAASRAHEFSTRKALGAGRGRLVRQLLAESLLLSATAGVFGLAVANFALTLLIRLAPEVIPSYADLGIGRAVILFNIAITLFAPMLFGLGPALSAVRLDTLRYRGDVSRRIHWSTRNLLVTAEVALSVVLVVCAGLLVRSLVRLDNVDPGFSIQQTLSFRIDLTDFTGSEQERARQYDGIEQRLLERPGIEAVGATVRPLLGGGSGGEASVKIHGRDCSLRLEIVTPGYFSAMRTHLLRGRFLKPSDTQKTGLVLVVNSAFEQTFFPEKNGLGKQIGLDARGAATIVGIVGDLKQERLDQPAQPAAFVSAAQIVPDALTFVVRGRGDRQTLLALSRRAVSSVNKAVPIASIATLDELVSSSTSPQRVRTSVLSLIAGAALLLAAVGLYGVLTYSVVQRSPEIGIRMALGASRQQVFRTIVLDGPRPVFVGAGIGLAAAYVASALMRSLLFGTAPTDHATYLLTILILATVSLLACIPPAVRAAHLDPMIWLRCQYSDRPVRV
jgi:putative ABC transport system permease protein